MESRLSEAPEHLLDSNAHFDLLPLRRAILKTMLVLALAGALLWGLWIPDPSVPPSFLPSIASVLLIALAYGASKRTYVLGVWLFLGGLIILPAGSALVSPGSLAPCFLAPLVLVTSLFLGPRSDILVGGMLGGLVVLGWLGPAQVISESVAATSLGLIAICALLSYVASKPLYTALDWSWYSFTQAREKMEEARARQAELGRVSKSLQESYLKLEQMSRDLERARKIAEEARRLKAEFAANISHELRTPLNLIVGFSEMMIMAPHAYEGDTLPASYRGDITAIYKSARHLSALIDDVLDLSQIEAGRMGLNKEWTTIAEIIRETTGVVDVLFQSKGLYLNVRLQEAVPLIHVDRTRIRQILINLLSNAVRYTDRGGVTIHVGSADKHVSITVSDTGVGIPEADLPHVFDEFHHLGTVAAHPHAEGSGLGLTICRRFAQLHGGTITVESTVGAGTTFQLSLPIWEPSLLAALPAVWPPRQLPRSDERREVAVLDGDTNAIRLFQRYLDGFHVVPAHAMQRGQVEALVIIASDWHDGWQKMQRIREVPQNLPLVLCLLPNIQDTCRRLGATGYLVKPISREALVSALTNLGRRPRKLLVVDDDPEMVRLLARMIHSISGHYRIWKAYGGSEALTVLQQRRPDAILLDLLMPGIDGYAVLERIRSDPNLKDVPVIVITAHGMASEAIVANLLAITSSQGLSVGQLMECLRASLSALRRSLGGDHDNLQAPQAVPAE